MQAAFYQQLDQTLSQIKADGFWKAERLIGTPQGPAIHLADGREVLNFCANNYLGLADHPRLVEAANDGLHSHGFGMASVRFICGTQDIHRELEGGSRASSAPRTRSSIPAASTPMAALFETLLGEDDAIISDALNHASIIDGIRLCKAKRYRYGNNDMDDLEAQLKAARRGRRPHQADRHRRRVLDGRHHRQAEGDLRPGRPLRRAGHGGRLPRHRLRRRARPRHAGTLRRRRPHRHPHRHARQGAGRRQRRLSSRRRPRSSICCASARGPISSPTRCAPASSRPRWRC